VRSKSPVEVQVLAHIVLGEHIRRERARRRAGPRWRAIAVRVRHSRLPLVLAMRQAAR
jgi:hypothetical protein